MTSNKNELTQIFNVRIEFFFFFWIKGSHDMMNQPVVTDGTQLGSKVGACVIASISLWATVQPGSFQMKKGSAATQKGVSKEPEQRGHQLTKLQKCTHFHIIFPCMSNQTFSHQPSAKMFAVYCMQI